MIMIKEILQIGEPVLREIAQEVEDIHCQETQNLIDELLDLTLKSHGVGIAAPQVGILKRIIVVASHPNIRYPDAPCMSPFAMINPLIVSHSQEIVIKEEGCLSVKQKRGMVARYRDIEVEYFTRDGQWHRKQYNNFIARIIQHELDHLNGILFEDHLQEDLMSEAQLKLDKSLI